MRSDGPSCSRTLLRSPVRPSEGAAFLSGARLCAATLLEEVEAERLRDELVRLGWLSSFHRMCRRQRC
jgi:hypothetical protein